MYKYILHIVFIFLVASAESKVIVPDTIRLQQINIVEKYIPDHLGYHVTKFDSIALKAYKQDNLSTLLSLQSPVFIKDYGPGNIASSSFRGANSTHTQVLWNGININSPMLGQVDFSQIPTSMIDEIIVYHGGASVAGNSGAIGGTVNILSDPDWSLKRQIDVMQEIGSFGKSHSYFSSQFKSGKLISKTRILHNVAENNYTYKEIPYEYSPTYVQENAAYVANSFIQELYYRISEKSTLSLTSWYQDNYNEIPTSTNDESQQNNSIKTFLTYKTFQSKWNVKAKVAHLYNYMNYKKNLIQIDSKNEINSMVSKVEFSYKVNSSLSLNIDNNFDYHVVESSNYSQKHERNEFDNTFSINGKNGLFNYYVGLKNQFIDFNSYRFIPSFGFDLNALSQISFFGSYNQNYHYPTLNDLYWQYDGNAMGNEELSPEKGFSTEAGFKTDLQKDKLITEFVFTIFYSKIDDWILWQYDENEVLNNQRLWFPINLKNVERKGVELSLKNKFQLNNLQIIHNINYQFVRAENTSSSENQTNIINKQLIYVPENLINSSLSILYKKYGLHMNYNFVDRRFTTTSNSDYLVSYSLLNLKFSRSFLFNHHLFNLQAGISNLTNQNYQVVSGRPMPGRIYSLSFKYRFQ